MSSQWFGRLSYLVHEIDDAVCELKQAAQDPHVQRELRLCGCSERVALINSALVEVDAVTQLCQICGEFLLGIPGQTNTQCVNEAALALTTILDVAFLKIKWAHCMCLSGRGECCHACTTCDKPKY